MVRITSADDQHEDALIHELVSHPGFPVMVGRVEVELKRLDRVLTTSVLDLPGPVDQREIDEHRGYRKGAAWFLREAKRTSKQFQKEDGEEA